MTRITVDPDLLSKLQNLTQPLELCDEAGQVLGRLFPNANLEGYDFTAPEISEEELRRREQSDKWYTTAEVLAHLEKL